MLKKTSDVRESLKYRNKEWLDQELSDCRFKDERIGKRFRVLCEQLWSRLGKSIPLACQDWANTKAAYRFFSNERVTENQILQGHFNSTKERFLSTDSPILILQDTTEFSYQRDEPESIGVTHIIPNGKDALGKTRRITKCGILMHSSLAVTTEGLPLGLTAIKFWTRKRFKGSNELKRHINPTRIPIQEKESYRWLENMQCSTRVLGEPNRCIHVGDRENDIYEFFCLAKELGTHFVVRACADRLTGDGVHTISDEMNEVNVEGLHKLEIKDKKGNVSEVFLELKYKRIRILPPVGKKKQFPELYLTVIHAQEQENPKNREKIVWKLITDLPISSCDDVIEKLNWYALRWKIELFHKILKSGCKAEDSKLQSAERLTKLISIFCILSWRIFWITMINRCCCDASPRFALTEIEIKILDQIVAAPSGKALSSYLVKIAKLGGYLARASDPPPGNIVIWRGLARLVDIQLGFNLASKIVGN